ncbi:TPA: hypothetical protein OLB66_002952 [Acinetobacter baumannii]|nr:hypothetical protein [Acinetobacter baumannii]
MPLTPETFQNLERDIEDTGKAVNTDALIEPRYGIPFKSLPMLSRLFEEMLGVGYVSVDDLKQAIEVAAAAGAGANGWTADLIVDGAETQKQINKKTVTHVECIADLINITNVWDGRTVYVKSVLKPIYGVALPFIAGGNFVYKASSTMQADGFLVVNAPNGRWIKALDESEITVDDFGGIGDNTKDNSDAFNAYASSPHVGMEIKLGKQGRYRVAKQVDLQGKNLVGSGMGKPNDKYYNLSSIDVDGSSPDLQGKTAFINCGPVIKNLTARCSNGAGKQVSFIEIDGYLANLQNLTIVNFYNQIVVKEALVGFYFKNIWSYYSQYSGIYCDDPKNRVSTTGVFDSVYFQLGDGYAFRFTRDIHGCQFRNIIFESMNGGITARTVANCEFGNFWCENLKTKKTMPWITITGTSNNAYANTIVGSIKVLGGWTDPSSPSNQPSSSNNFGCSVVGPLGISIGNASNANKMSMTTKGFTTGNGTIVETRTDSNSALPITKLRLIGGDANGVPYLSSDMWTKTLRKWNTYNHGSNSVGQFVAPMFLTYDQSLSTQQDNAGWIITKESVGVYRVERKSGNTNVLTNPNIVIGSPLMGSRLGTGTGATHGVQMIETYPGSWTSFAEAAGFKVFWRDAANALVDPHRFTVAFTLNSGF